MSRWVIIGAVLAGCGLAPACFPGLPPEDEDAAIEDTVTVIDNGAPDTDADAATAPDTRDVADAGDTTEPSGCEDCTHLDDGPCVRGICVEGACQARALDGEPCDDGLFCTVDDRCVAGQCTGEPRDCADAFECTIDTCDEDEERCEHVEDGCADCRLEPSGSCDDGDPCNGVETCDDGDGRCVAGDPVVCEGSGDACTRNRCDPDTGACALENDDTLPCSDGDACTVGDGCEGGVCVPGDPVTCPDLGQDCAFSACASDTGQCVTRQVDDGLPCDEDGDVCTVARCDAGACVDLGPPDDAPGDWAVVTESPGDMTVIGAAEAAGGGAWILMRYTADVTLGPTAEGDTLSLAVDAAWAYRYAAARYSADGHLEVLREVGATAAQQTWKVGPRDDGGFYAVVPLEGEARLGEPEGGVVVGAPDLPRGDEFYVGAFKPDGRRDWTRRVYKNPEGATSGNITGLLAVGASDGPTVAVRHQTQATGGVRIEQPGQPTVTIEGGGLSVIALSDGGDVERARLIGSGIKGPAGAAVSPSGDLAVAAHLTGAGSTITIGEGEHAITSTEQPGDRAFIARYDAALRPTWLRLMAGSELPVIDACRFADVDTLVCEGQTPRRVHWLDDQGEELAGLQREDSAAHDDAALLMAVDAAGDVAWWHRVETDTGSVSIQAIDADSEGVWSVTGWSGEALTLDGTVQTGPAGAATFTAARYDLTTGALVTHDAIATAISMTRIGNVSVTATTPPPARVVSGLVNGPHTLGAATEITGDTGGVTQLFALKMNSASGLVCAE